MTAPRLKTHIRVAVLLQRVQANGVFATIARKGDPDAGSIAVKAFGGAASVQIFVEARKDDGAHFWRSVFDGPADERTADEWLRKEADFDTDLWTIEIETSDAERFLTA